MALAHGSDVVRATAPAVPPATREQERAAARDVEYKAAREDVERERQMRGLIVLVIAVIVFSVMRAGVDRVFTPGWWRVW